MANNQRSPVQQEASRQNGIASRGPRTSEGKARSSGNATTHGLRAERVLLRHEDPDLYRQHVEKWVAALQPDGVAELEVVIAVADVRWKLMRLGTIEANRLRGEVLDRLEEAPEARYRRLLEDAATATRIMAEVVAGPFLGARDLTHRAADTDRLRWKKHLAPCFGPKKPHEVGASLIRRFIEAKLAEGLNPATIRIFMALLSAVFASLVEDGIATTNPCHGLPRSTRRLMKPTHDPRTTPFIEKLADIRRIFLLLPLPISVAYALGVLAGLRTGDIFALRWLHVDLAARRIHVRESVKGPLRDKDSRVVPVLDPLLPILSEWKLKSGGEGLLIPPLRSDGKKIDKATPGDFLRPVPTALGLVRPGLGWYEATRHTFASQWVMAGGSIERLKEILGHYSVVMTERYAHLKPELFTPKDMAVIDLDLAAGDAVPLPLGQSLGRTPASLGSKELPHRYKCRSRPVSRVLSPRGPRGPRGGKHSSRTRVAARLQRAVPGG
jgi:integrase